MLTKLISGSTTRRTRLHDERGNLVPVSRALRNGPRALASALVVRMLGKRSLQPWISYDAQKQIAAFLTPRSRVLEYGSGMSTVWYAQHAGEVVSIEDFAPWFDQVGAIIAERGVGNVRYRIAAEVADYTMPTEEERGAGFDLIMIDGSARDRCVAAALPLLRAGGMIYLDNSDKSACPVSGDVPAARQLLLDFARADGADVTKFTDFAPTQLFVQEGLMIRRR
jgi:hypothetical protein